MKKTWIIIFSLSASLSAFAQGQVNFNTHITSDIPPVDARILNFPDGSPWTDGFAQLAIVNSNGSIVPLAPTGVFGTGAEAGYVNVGTATAPAGYPGGTTVNLLLRAWKGDPGSTYDTATIKGQTAPILVTLTESPNKPNDLIGLQGFMLVPEPTILALGALSIGVLLLQKRR